MKLPCAFLCILSLLPCGAQARLRVVTSFSILGDFVRQVAGDEAEVISLVGPDADAHVYEPTPHDIQELAKADLLIANGLGFEPWLAKLAAASGYRGPLVVASRGIVPLKLGDMAEDPHAWQDVGNAEKYVLTIRDALIAADPAHAEIYRARAAAYEAELAALDGRVRARIAQIPPEQRRMMMTHDAFAYFARAYGVGIVSITGISTAEEPAAGDLARVEDQLKAHRIRAVFIENMTDGRLADQLRRDTGASRGGVLYSDALSLLDGPAPDYLALMRHNVETLVNGMKAGAGK